MRRHGADTSDEELLAEHNLESEEPDVESLEANLYDEVCLDGERYEKIYYLLRWRFVCAHFTEAAAEAYIVQNSHNLTDPRVYVTSQSRCYEWQDVMGILGAAQR